MRRPLTELFVSAGVQSGHPILAPHLCLVVLTDALRRGLYGLHGSQEERALEEATVLSRLSHSSIVRLLSFESRPSYHYLVLEVGPDRAAFDGNVVGSTVVTSVLFQLLWELRGLTTW